MLGDCVVVFELNGHLIAARGMMRSVDVHIDVQEIWFDPMHVRHYDSGWRTIDVSMVAQQIVERDGTFDDVWNDTSRDGKPYEQPALPGMSKELPS